MDNDSYTLNAYANTRKINDIQAAKVTLTYKQPSYHVQNSDNTKLTLRLALI